MPPYPLLFTSIALFLLLLHLYHTQKPQHQHHHQQQFLSPQGKFSFQEKTRLGSTPPSCHNKCNGCHPCMAVKVPSVPVRKVSAARGDDVVVVQQQTSSSTSRSGDGVMMRGKKRLVPDSMEYFDPTPAAGRYSNYKPLGWKCRCGNHFFNP